MFTSIIKRDGEEKTFDDGKITNAIYKCLRANGKDDRHLAIKLTLDVLNKTEQELSDKKPTVEYIQDQVENVLIEQGLAKAAKSYILYREDRSRRREARSELMNAVSEILQETNRDNANVGNSPSAKVLQISEIASKNYYLKRVLSEKEANAHINGDIYIHDLSWYGKTMTCLQIPLNNLLREGFNNGHGFIRPPKGIKTAASLAAIILQSNQNDMHGGQSFAYFDRDMAVYVELEKTKQEKYLRQNLQELGVTADEEKIKKLVYERTKDETYQAMEGFIYNLNTMHSRAGAQVPFSSINLGTDTSEAGRMVTECFLLAYEKGLGKGESPLFPNVCFKIKEDVNFEEGDPNYDLFKLSMRVACKRLFPAYSFQDSSFNKPFCKKIKEEGSGVEEDVEVAYMGCRTRVVANCKGPEITNSRGNLSFTTINLPRIGIRAGKDISLFWKYLDEMIDTCIEQLLSRYNVQKKLKVKDFPFLMGQKLYLGSEKLNYDDTIEDAICNGTLTVGFIGLAECLVALMGKHHGESAEAQAVGIAIVGHLHRRCNEATKKYKLNFSLLATPAEQLSGKFTKLDAERYGDIPGVTNKEWYTNSFHVPVEFQINALKKIEIEGAYHKYCNAGHISYIELQSAPENNLDAFESIIRAMADADMGYGAINFPVDICKDCGLNGIIEGNTCPKCGGANISRVRRITGYLSTLDRFNDSKLAEIEHRLVHQNLN
ncbi:MAG: anaerobic ribonucleoside-triphosphate reductase [Treponema sp.]|nr:anaerobic ribonucleoside-triphosphate reductase [Treponema sp.]